MVVDKDISNVVGVVSKMDFLMFMIKKYLTNEETEEFLQKPILGLNIGVSKDEIDKMSWDVNLRQVFKHMSDSKISCVPIVDEQSRYQGVIQKWHILHIFKKAVFNYLNQPIREFIKYLSSLTQNNFEKGVALIHENDSLRDVIQKFVFSRGQALYVDSDGYCQSLITINDIINYLI